MTQNHKQNQNENRNTSAFGSPLKKRVAVGAVTAMAAGSLLGLGAVGANAAPLDSSTDTGSTNTTTSTNAAETPDVDLTEAEALDQITTLTEQLRGQLATANQDGANEGEAAQVVTDAIAEHADLFQSLPVNLQTDLTALGEANSDQAIAADTIETTALSGGYGEQIQALAEAIQQDPAHPLAAVLQALAANDAVAGDVATGDLAEGEHDKGENGDHAKGGLSAEKITDALAANPALFEKLPQELQADLTELQAAPEGDRAAGADAIKTTALEGGYGEQIQAIAERVVANFDAAEAATGAEAEAEAESGAEAEAEAEAGAEAEAEAEAGAEVESNEADTDVKTDAEVKAGGHDAN